MGDNRLSILPLIGIGPRFQGRSISKLQLQAKSESGMGLVAVQMGGVDVTPFQAIGPESSKLVFELPASARRITENLTDPLFHIRGNVVVESVGLRLVPLQETPRPPERTQPPTPPRPPERTQPRPPTPPTPPEEGPRQPNEPTQPSLPPTQPRKGTRVTAEVHRTFRDGQELALRQLVDLGTFQGMKLDKAILIGKSLERRGELAFCLGRCTTVETRPGKTSYAFSGHGTPVTRKSNSWAFRFGGHFRAEKVLLELLR
jgi:hypothetical protein